MKKRYAAPQKDRHDREFEFIDLAGRQEGSKQDAAAKQPDGFAGLPTQPSNGASHICVDNVHGRIGGCVDCRGDDVDIPPCRPWRCSGALSQLVGTPAEKSRVELGVYGGEIESGVWPDPIGLAIWACDETVEARGYTVLDGSHAFVVGLANAPEFSRGVRRSLPNQTALERRRLQRYVRRQPAVLVSGQHGLLQVQIR